MGATQLLWNMMYKGAEVTPEALQTHAFLRCDFLPLFQTK